MSRQSAMRRIDEDEVLPEDADFSFSLSLERLMQDPEGCKKDLERLFKFVREYGLSAVPNPASCGCEDLPARVAIMLEHNQQKSNYQLAHQLAEEIFQDLWQKKIIRAKTQSCFQ